MSGKLASFLRSDSLDRSQPYVLRLAWRITAAVTVADVYDYQQGSVLTAFGAISAQSTIDTHLGTTSEFDYLAFDATSLGDDAFAFIVNMEGQCKKLLNARAVCFSNTGGSDRVERMPLTIATTLTNTSLTTQAAKGANGNVAMRVIFGNTPDFDALTAGVIKAELEMYLN